MQALDEFDRSAKEVLSPFLREMESREPPELVFHYTTDSGLKGILETGKLWLSDIRGDTSDFMH